MMTYEHNLSQIRMLSSKPRGGHRTIWFCISVLPTARSCPPGAGGLQGRWDVCRVLPRDLTSYQLSRLLWLSSFLNLNSLIWSGESFPAFHLISQISGLCLEPGTWDSKAKNMTPLLSIFCWFFLPWSSKDGRPSCLMGRKQGIAGKMYRQILPSNFSLCV